MTRLADGSESSTTSGAYATYASQPGGDEDVSCDHVDEDTVAAAADGLCDKCGLCLHEKDENGLCTVEDCSHVGMECCGTATGPADSDEGDKPVIDVTKPEGGDTTQPVSYTHLDVYKRQTWKLNPHFGNDGNVMAEKVADGVTEAKTDTLNPTSGTYKVRNEAGQMVDASPAERLTFTVPNSTYLGGGKVAVLTGDNENLKALAKDGTTELHDVSGYYLFDQLPTACLLYTSSPMAPSRPCTRAGPSSTATRQTARCAPTTARSSWPR